MLKRTILTGMAAFVFATTAISKGTSGFELLRSEVSARGAGAAGALIAFPSGLDGLFYNPAALAGIEKRQAAVTYLNHLLDIESGYLAYGQDFRKTAACAVSLNYINYGDFKRTDAAGNELGNGFSPADILVTLAAAKKLSPSVSLGFGLKYIRSQIWEVSASAAAFDAGILLDTGWKQWTLGAGVFNLGKTLDEYYSYEEKLPLSYKIGASKPLEHLPMVIMAQLEKCFDSGLYFSAGGEFTVSEYLKFRLGWSARGREQKANTNRDIFAGASAGLGLAIKSMTFDYSFSSMGEMGVVSRVSVNYRF